MEREDNRAVAAGGQADDCTAAALGDRAEVRVDVVDDVARDRRLPVATRAPVEVLGIGVVVARALRRDDDRFPAAVLERAGEKVRAAERGRRRREPV
jgi:hypothetical protein